MEADYGIRIQQGSKLVIASNNAYDLGEQDFTVTALFQTTQPGIIISQMPSEGGGGDGGWFLSLQANGAIELSLNRTTDDGPTYHKAISNPTSAFDGSWHSIAAIRQDGNILIFFDGISIEVTSDSNDSPPFNVSNSAQIFIGDCDREALQFLGIDENISQFIGILEDISIWNRALSQAEIKRTMFNQITPEDPGLVGFWEMNRNLEDTSRINNLAISVGSVSWVPIFHCVWAETINNYSYCAIDLSENLVEDHGVQIDNGGMIAIPPNSAYNFGLGEFTLTAIFQTTQPGTIVSCKSNAVTSGGWLLALEQNGWFRMKFWNNDGRYFNVFCSRANKDALDGQWHHIAFTRKPGTDWYKFFFDGQIAGLVDNPRISLIQPYFDIHNFDRVVIGNCDNEREANRQFVGIIEDVTIWNRALSQDEIQRTRFNETNPNDQGLVGFWKLDQNFDDSSPTRNNGSGAGSVKFVEVAHQAKRQQTLKIAEETSYLYGVALDKSKSSVTFPEGALVKVFRPDGTQLDQDSNTDDLFVKMNGNSVWAFTVKNPQAGDWKFAVECPTSTPFLLSIQTTPSKDVAPTIGNALQELYVDAPATRTQTFSTLANNTISTPVSSGRSLLGAQAGLTLTGLASLGIIAGGPALWLGAAAVLGVGLFIHNIIEDDSQDIQEKSDLVGKKMGIGGDFIYQKNGQNSYRYFVHDNDSNYQNELVNYRNNFQIDSGTPYLYAVLTQNDNSIDFPVGAILNVQAPDGTNYNHDIQDENSLAITSNSSIRCLIINNPQSGSWNISINAPEGVKFHCELGTVPSKDVFDTIADTYKVQDDAIDQLIPPFTGITDAILIGNQTDNLPTYAKDFLDLFTSASLGITQTISGTKRGRDEQVQLGNQLAKRAVQSLRDDNQSPQDIVKEDVVPVVATASSIQKPVKSITIASWNIEKNGQSSTPEKQGKVSDFIDTCCKELGITVVFLCEVHSARIEDYTSFLEGVYGANYTVNFLAGGYNNAYVYLIRKDAEISASYYQLRGLNRAGLLLQNGELFCVLAHFKSGQTGLTKDQIQQAASSLQSINPALPTWAITGDMNWDYNNFEQLDLNVLALRYTCWLDQTQAKGGILDWCLASYRIDVHPLDVKNLFPAEVNNMEGPDHRPIAFTIIWEPSAD